MRRVTKAVYKRKNYGLNHNLNSVFVRSRRFSAVFDAIER